MPTVSGATAIILVSANPVKPPGDDFAEAISLTGTSGSDSINMLGATREGTEPPNVFGDPGAETVWLTYTPTEAGDLTFIVGSPLVDHLIGVEIWEGATVSDLEFAGSDNSNVVGGPGLESTAVVAVAANTRYNIRIHPETAGQQLQALEYDWSFGVRQVPLLVTLREVVVDQTPATLIASITNGTADADIEFTIDSSEVTEGTTITDVIWEDELDETGLLTDIAVPVPELLAGNSVVATHGYRLVATEPVGGRTGYVEFGVETDPLIRPTDLDPDTGPVLIPRVGVQRWVVQDPSPGGTSYVFPINPAEMTTPHAPRTVTVERTTAVDGQPLSYEGARKPHQWEWRGYLDTQAHHDALVAYVASNRRYWLIDHRNRAWMITFEAFEAQPQISPNVPFAHRYTMRCLIYAGPEQL